MIGLARRPSPDASASVLVDIAQLRRCRRGLRRHPAGPAAGARRRDRSARSRHCRRAIRTAWRRTVEVNLLGTYNVLRAALAGRACTGARHSDPRDDRSRIECEALLERLRRHQGRRRAPRPLGRKLTSPAATAAVCSLDPGITETAMQQELRISRLPRSGPLHTHLRGAGLPHSGGGRRRDLGAVTARAERDQWPDVQGRVHSDGRRSRLATRRTS